MYIIPFHFEATKWWVCREPDSGSAAGIQDLQYPDQDVVVDVIYFAKDADDLYGLPCE